LKLNIEPSSTAACAEPPPNRAGVAGFAATLALGLLRAYKVLISPYFAGSCRFLPSCADYTRDAILRHGVLRGCWLGLRRLTRCHPLCAGGHDPVPGTRI